MKINLRNRLTTSCLLPYIERMMTPSELGAAMARLRYKKLSEKRRKEIAAMGGTQRAENLSAEQRSDIARKGGRAKAKARLAEAKKS